MQSTDKARSLIDCLTLDHPDLRTVRDADDPAGAYVSYLRERRWGAHRFEWGRKEEMLAFLREHYEAWRAFDTSAADRYVDMPIEDAQRARALSGVRALGEAWWATGDPRYGQAFERFYRAAPTGEMFSWGSFNGSQGAI